MGADLYIKNMDRESQYRGFEVSDEAVAVGYFRDSYNNRGLFAVMSSTLNETVSWWKMAREVGLNENYVLSLVEVKIWKKMILPLLEQFQKTNKLYYKDYDDAKKKLIKDPKEIKEYHDWAGKLIRFIELAIEKKSGIIWSV